MPPTSIANRDLSSYWRASKLVKRLRPATRPAAARGGPMSVPQAAPRNARTALTKGQRIWQDNHERLYDAALREIERVGFNDVRIEKICEETKLSRPTFYAHFSNKDSVVSEFLCRFMDAIARGLEARTKRPHDLENVIDELVRLCCVENVRTPERLRRELAAYLPRHHD